jgi:formate hydrogenlyase subunit 6/NADH:ubiquinone oxidoreductase subunit I
MQVKIDACILCNACQKACPVNIRIYENPDSTQCIRCLKCESVCPTDCLSHGFWLESVKKEKEKGEPATV